MGHPLSHLRAHLTAQNRILGALRRVSQEKKFRVSEKQRSVRAKLLLGPADSRCMSLSTLSTSNVSTPTTIKLLTMGYHPIV